MEPISIQVDVVPGKLVVRVWHHEVDALGGPVACWSYVTSGLRNWGQKEVILTVSRGVHEVASSELPIQFFRQVGEFAAQGRLVDVGDLTEFGQVGFMGNFKGILYTWSLPLPGIELAHDALAAILATEEELSVVKRCGVTRVVVRLGHAYRYFPYPPWSDRSRSSVVTSSFWQRSVLSKLALTVRVTGATVRKEQGQVHLRLPQKAVGLFEEGISQAPANAPIAFVANPDPEADAMLVWEPGQRQPEAISPPGSTGERVGGCFVVFLPEQGSNGGEPFEDGFVMKLTNPSWEQISQAVRSCRPVLINGATGSPVFRLSWVTDTTRSAN
jgi:hypothetical protein